MDYNRSWAELNAHLNKAVAGPGGLTAALLELEAHQRETGFIKDDLDSVRRYVFRSPNNPDRFFRVQYNPKRALRFKGKGVYTPPTGATLVHDGCFLCRENIRWQQQNAQVGFEISMTHDGYHAWVNPFPLLPNHVIIAADDHKTQEWNMDGKGGADLTKLLFDLCGTARSLPHHIGFYNGVDAGASIPRHLHFQFFNRAPEGPVFPLEGWEFEGAPGNKEPMMATGYPLSVARWRGNVEPVVAKASAWVRSWVEGNSQRLERLSSNFIAAAHGPDGVDLYFVPRDRTKTRWNGMFGLVGGLEVLGELVFSSEEERGLIENGAVDYDFIEAALASVHTPFFED